MKAKRSVVSVHVPEGLLAALDAKRGTQKGRSGYIQGLIRQAVFHKLCKCGAPQGLFCSEGCDNV